LISGCASPDEHKEIKIPDIIDAEYTEMDSPDSQDVPSTIPFPEPHIPSNSETMFIAELNRIGLNWSLSDAQRVIDPDLQTIERNRTYFIDSPSNSVFGLIILRTEAGTFWGDNHIHMTFSPTGMLTEDERNRLQQGHLLADNEWFLFWEFAGKFLGEEAYVASIAARSLEYLEYFPFDYKTEYSVVLMDGNEGNIDYRVLLNWNPFFERYLETTIALTAGLPEVYRELIKEFGENRPW